MSRREPSTRLRRMRLTVLDSSEDAAAGASPEPAGEAERLFLEALRLVYREQDFAGALERFQEARRWFDGALEKGECLIEEAHVHSLQADGIAASAALEEALKILPAEPPELRGEVCRQRARLLSHRGLLAEALEAHLAARPWYEAHPEPGLAEFHGVGCWIRERLGDMEGWAAEVRELVRLDPDKLALHKLPQPGAATTARCEKLCAGLDRLLAEPRDDHTWLVALKAMSLFIARQTEEAVALLEGELPRLGEGRSDEGADAAFERAFVRQLAGKCYLKLEQPRKALACFEAARRDRGPSFDLTLDLAMVHESLGHFDRALEFYEGLEGGDESSRTAARRAVLNERLQRKREAVEAWRQVNERAPKNRSALVRLALLNAELERDEDALQWLDRAIQATGPEPTLLLTRGRVKFRLGRLKAAQKDARRALELLEPLVAEYGEETDLPDPGSGDAPPPAGDPEGSGDHPVMLGSAARLVAEGRLLLAKVLHATGRLAEARELVAHVLEEQPDNSEALLLQGDCSRNLGDARSAVETYKSVIDKILCETLLKDGLKLAGQGRINEALAKFQAARERFPENWEVFYSMAQAHAALGDMDAAAKHLAIARKTNRDVLRQAEQDESFASFRGTEAWQALRGEG